MDNLSSLFFFGYVDCHVSCGSPIMDKFCGNEEASEFFEDFIQSVFTDSEAEFEKLELAEFWPDSCTDVAKGQFQIAKDIQVRNSSTTAKRAAASSQSALRLSVAQPGG